MDLLSKCFCSSCCWRRRASLTCEAGATLAAVAVAELVAAVRAARVAGVGQTLVDDALAALAHEAGRAGAVVAAHPVHTLAVVETLGLFGDGVGERVAVVHVDLTVHT